MLHYYEMILHAMVVSYTYTISIRLHNINYNYLFYLKVGNLDCRVIIVLYNLSKYILVVNFLKFLLYLLMSWSLLTASLCLLTASLSYTHGQFANVVALLVKGLLIKFSIFKTTCSIFQVCFLFSKNGGIACIMQFSIQNVRDNTVYTLPSVLHVSTKTACFS